MQFKFYRIDRESSRYNMVKDTCLAAQKLGPGTCDDVTTAKGEGAVMERCATSEGCDSAGFAERTESAQASDTSSHSRAGGYFDEGSHTHSYYFGPSTVTVCRIREMIDHGYFAKGSARVPGEETVLDPTGDEVVVFEEFLTTGLRMPPHLVLSDILLKF
jgi:hypothetical protein